MPLFTVADTNKNIVFWERMWRENFWQIMSVDLRLSYTSIDVLPKNAKEPNIFKIISSNTYSWHCKFCNQQIVRRRQRVREWLLNMWSLIYHWCPHANQTPRYSTDCLSEWLGEYCCAQFPSRWFLQQRAGFHLHVDDTFCWMHCFCEEIELI